MPFSEFEHKRYEKIMTDFIEKRRPPVEIRDEVDLWFKIDKYSIEIFEIRPEWNNPDQKQEIPLAKTTYVNKQKIWKIFWQRSDLKWHRYDPEPDVDTLEEFISIIDEDAFHCFWG